MKARLQEMEKEAAKLKEQQVRAGGKSCAAAGAEGGGWRGGRRRQAGKELPCRGMDGGAPCSPWAAPPTHRASQAASNPAVSPPALCRTRRRRRRGWRRRGLAPWSRAGRGPRRRWTGAACTWATWTTPAPPRSCSSTSRCGGGGGGWLRAGVKRAVAGGLRAAPASKAGWMQQLRHPSRCHQGGGCVRLRIAHNGQRRHGPPHAFSP